MTQFQKDFRTLRPFMPDEAADSIGYSIKAIEAIMDALYSSHEPMRCKEISAFAKMDHRGIDGSYTYGVCVSYQKVANTLIKMARAGLVERVPVGVYNRNKGQNQFEEVAIYGYRLKR